MMHFLRIDFCQKVIKRKIVLNRKKNLKICSETQEKQINLL